MKMNNRLAAAAIMVGLFTAGAVTGGALVGVLGADTPGWAQDGRRDWSRGDERRERDHERDRGDPRDPRVSTDRVVKGLTHRLDLDETQQDTIRAILEAQGREARQIFRQMVPPLRALMDSTNASIRTLLTEEQRAEFDELLAEDRNLLGRRFEPRDSTSPGGDGGRGSR